MGDREPEKTPLGGPDILSLLFGPTDEFIAWAVNGMSDLELEVVASTFTDLSKRYGPIARTPYVVACLAAIEAEQDRRKGQ